MVRIQYECRKIQTRTTPNTDTFHAVILVVFLKCFQLNDGEYSKMIIREHIQIDILGVFSKFLDYIFIIFIKFRYRINVFSKSKLLLY